VDADKGVPLTFDLKHGTTDGVEKATWRIGMSDGHGNARGNVIYTAALPANARESAWETTLVAATTSNLSQVRTWLAMSEGSTQ